MHYPDAMYFINKLVDHQNLAENLNYPLRKSNLLNKNGDLDTLLLKLE